MVIVVAQEKGGVGKSTIAFNLAVMRALAGKDVLLVDADSQGSSQECAYVREEEGVLPKLNCTGLIGKAVNTEVRKLKDKYDDIVVDVGGRDSAGFRSALLAADRLIIPVLPSQIDAWTLDHLSTVIEEAKAFNESLFAMAVVNKMDTNPHIKLGQDLEEYLRSFSNIMLLPTRVCYRVAYRKSIAEGRAVTELSPADPKARNEMECLYKEVFA